MASSPTPQVSDIINSLHAACSAAVEVSLSPQNQLAVAQSHLFVNDLELWVDILSDKPEYKLFSLATQEYLLSLTNACQGQYRNAFKGLRLVFELCLQGILLSTNTVLLNEWLRSDADTNWSAIMDDQNGVFSVRFCRAFFPEIQSHVKAFHTLAKTLYRELSECIHGNIPKNIPLPVNIGFDSSTFALWHTKAETARLVIQFALCMRYLPQIAKTKKDQLEPAVSQVLFYIEQIRSIFEAGEVA